MSENDKSDEFFQALAESVMCFCAICGYDTNNMLTGEVKGDEVYMRCLTCDDVDWVHRAWLDHFYPHVIYHD